MLRNVEGGASNHASGAAEMSAFPQPPLTISIPSPSLMQHLDLGGLSYDLESQR
jgi:hypothetical protein